MASQFGFISKLEFLQDWASAFISGINPAITHNLEKYNAIKKVHYLSAIEDMNGDYLEFGVFTGSSFCHSIRCCEKLGNINQNILRTKFIGFDSFEGFGDLIKNDEHPFYKDENFSTSLLRVNKRVSCVAKKVRFKLVPGFFSDSLKAGPAQLGIEKARIIFIDSDTYSSAKEALLFCAPITQEGTFFILDDFYSYKGSELKGVKRAFNEFVSEFNLKVRHVFHYGMGGAVYIISEKS
jgi:O-methyltransferase